LLSTPSSSADCKEEEQPSTKGKGKKKESINCEKKQEKKKG